MAELTVAAGLARGLFELAVAKGADRAELALRAGFEAAELEDQDRRVPMDRYVALMRAGKELTGDGALAIDYGERVDMAAFSAVGMLFHASETILESLREINRYGKLVIEVDLGEGERFPFVRRDGGLWLVDMRRNPNDFPELTEATFARFVGMTRQVLDAPIVLELHVTHPAPAHAADYARICGGPVVFESGWNAMRIDEEQLVRPIARQPRYVFGIFSEHAGALLKTLENSRTTRGRVEALLMPILHTGNVGVERIAAELGISRQTLFRRLKAEGTSFEHLLDALRHRLALHYLGGEKVSVNETAYLVGFSDPAAFSRAFKRWTGTSPRAMRERQAGIAIPAPIAIKASGTSASSGRSRRSRRISRGRRP